MDCSADIILTGGPVFTSSSALGIQEAVATKGNRILAVGKAQDIMAFSGPKTRHVALKGCLLMPGFIDAHLHYPWTGMNRLNISCKYPNVHSIRDIQERLREKAASTPPGKWVRGWGYDHLKLKEKRHPTRYDLDGVSQDRPVLLTRTCGHISVANSKALEMAGVSGSTPDPVGGKFDRDESGVPNGVMREAAAHAVNKIATYTDAELVEGVVTASAEFASQGITSVHDAGTSFATMRALVEAVRTGRAKVRAYAMIGSAEPEYQRAYLESGLSTGFGDQRLKIGSFKLMTDGSSSGPTAATSEPYAIDPDNTGILYLTQEEISERFSRAHRLGFQVTAHAVGDRAVEMVINGIEQAVSAVHRDDPRHRIEHCAMTGPALRARIKNLGIIPVAQPVFFYEFGDGYVQNYGRKRAEQMFTVGSFIREGIPFAMSTDCPVTYSDPMLNLYTAITRETMSGDVVAPEERLTVEQTLAAYTMGGAYAAHEERIKGSIEPGKLADLVVLTGNPLSAPASQIRAMKARMTIIDGEVVYEV